MRKEKKFTSRYIENASKPFLSLKRGALKVEKIIFWMP